MAGSCSIDNTHFKSTMLFTMVTLTLTLNGQTEGELVHGWECYTIVTITYSRERAYIYDQVHERETDYPTKLKSLI